MFSSISKLYLITHMHAYNTLILYSFFFYKNLLIANPIHVLRFMTPSLILSAPEPYTSLDSVMFYV